MGIWTLIERGAVFGICEQVVTRTGVPTNDDDLKRCSASYARSMIILSPPDLLPHEADAKVRRRIFRKDQVN
jgi:hypothetical protein